MTRYRMADLAYQQNSDPHRGEARWGIGRSAGGVAAEIR